MSSRSSKGRYGIRDRKYGVILPTAAAVLAALLSIPFLWQSGRSSETYSGATAEARFFDVGQGDAAMFLWDDGAILIDAGTNDSQDKLVGYIDRLGIDVIDCAVFTHPHEDHIGGADRVLEEFTVKSVIMPDTTSDSITYASMMECVEEEGCHVYDAVSGGVYEFGDVLLTVLAPAREFGGLNLDSAVVMIEYGEVRFLFMADCEKEAELAAIEAMGEDAFDCDVIKVGHHGSYTSTSDELLAAATPDIAVISCGDNNEYGHPHRETVEKIENLGIDIYRTDEDGTVVISTDGKNFWYNN